jgi:hypothetical protein
MEVFPLSAMEFFYTLVDVTVTFVKDRSGKVTGLMLHERGHDIPAERTVP